MKDLTKSRTNPIFISLMIFIGVIAILVWYMIFRKKLLEVQNTIRGDN
ncbi:MAG: hypothetical protein ACFE9A_21325 [Candidatus Hodarchaeota archaeon]